MKVSIFSTCVVDLLFPNVGQAMVEVLERYGCETVLPTSQTCCGQPTYNSGYVTESTTTLKNQIDSFDGADYVVGPAGSCVGMMKEYHKFLADDPIYGPKAQRLAERTYEFSQFLYRVLGVKESPFVLLDHVKGLEMIPLGHLENCCGFGGTFSVKMPAISEQMVTEKMNDVIDTGAEILISADMGCLMNIGGKFNRDGKKIKIMHIAEVLNHEVDEARMDQPQIISVG